MNKNAKKALKGIAGGLAIAAAGVVTIALLTKKDEGIEVSREDNDMVEMATVIGEDDDEYTELGTEEAEIESEQE
ncbi:MAG: hypothetical protein RR420_00990 [Anaerovoracaceae bacterium]